MSQNKSQVTNLNSTFKIRINQKQKQKLIKHAKKLGVSSSQLIRDYIEEGSKLEYVFSPQDVQTLALKIAQLSSQIHRSTYELNRIKKENSDSLLYELDFEHKFKRAMTVNRQAITLADQELNEIIKIIKKQKQPQNLKTFNQDIRQIKKAAKQSTTSSFNLS